MVSQCDARTHGAVAVPAGFRGTGRPTYLKRTTRCQHPAVGTWEEYVAPGVQVPAGYKPMVKHYCAEHAAELKPRFWRQVVEQA